MAQLESKVICWQNSLFPGGDEISSFKVFNCLDEADPHDGEGSVLFQIHKIKC